MSAILNNIKQVVAQSVKVEVKNPVVRNNKMKYPVIVTDISNSFTSGWFIQYNPMAQDNGTRLYDGSETFSELHIARFSQLRDIILTANMYFLQGIQVEPLRNNRKRAIYEPNQFIRLTVTGQANSQSVVLTIVDDNSPFHMLSIPFTVVPDSIANNGSYHIIGTQEDRYDRNTDIFKELNASFAPGKTRFYRVDQKQGQAPMLKARIAVRNGQYAINQDGSFEVDTNAVSPEYIQVISNEYKALAYIYERAVMEVAFENAIAQGLPYATQPQQQPNQAPASNQPAGFVPAFTLNNAGAPNPVVNQTPANSGNVPLSNAQPGNVNQPEFQGSAVPNPPQPAQCSVDNDLPWATNNEPARV